MKIELDKPAREALVRALSTYLAKELEVEIGGVDALLLLDFISETVGPHYYNQALHDSRALLRSKIEALDEAFYELEKPVKL